MARTKEEIAAALFAETIRYSKEFLVPSGPPYQQLRLSAHERMALRQMMANDVQRAQAWLLETITHHDGVELNDDNDVLIDVPFNVDGDGDEEYPFCGQLMRADENIWAIVEYVYEHKIDTMNTGRDICSHTTSRAFLFNSEGAARAAFFGFRVANTAWRLSNLEAFESGDEAAA